MARTVTYEQLKERFEQTADIEGDTHLSEPEKRRIINESVAETWDVLCNCGLAEKFVKSVSFNTVAGQLEYTFAATATDGDFYRLHALYVNEGGGQLRSLMRVQPAEIEAFKPPTSVVAMKMYYIPCAPKLSTATADATAWNAQTFDGINGWEDHTVYSAVLKSKAKKDDDFNNYFRLKKEVEQRMTQLGNIDFNEPIRIHRKRTRRRNPFYSFNSNVNAYGIRGDKLELYYYDGYTV